MTSTYILATSVDKSRTMNFVIFENLYFLIFKFVSILLLCIKDIGTCRLVVTVWHQFLAMLKSSSKKFKIWENEGLLLKLLNSFAAVSTNKGRCSIRFLLKVYIKVRFPLFFGLPGLLTPWGRHSLVTFANLSSPIWSIWAAHSLFLISTQSIICGMPLICLKCLLRTLSLWVFPCMVLIILKAVVRRNCWVEIVSTAYVNTGRTLVLYGKCELCSLLTY